jgi:hypothetical protein
MKRSFVAVFINALAFFCISGGAQAQVNLQPATISSSAQEFMGRMTSEPAAIALFGTGLLVIGGIIRRRRSKSIPSA